MAFGQEAVEQLSRELLSGYNLNTRLLALLSKPLDNRGQDAAVVMIQELSGVLKNLIVSLFMLKSGDSSGVVELRKPSPEATVMEGHVDRRTPAKDKCIRQYYKCMYSHDRSCRAKKQVQQQDSSSGSSPLYHVTYVNGHTCHQVLPKQNISVPPTLTPTEKNISRTRSSRFDHRQGHVVNGNVELENNIMTWTLTAVIGGPSSPSSLPSPQPLEADPSDPAMYSYPPDVAGHVATLLDVSTGLDASRFPPLEELAAPSLPSSLPPPLPLPASSSYPVGGSGNFLSMSMDAMTMEEMDFMCDPLFSPAAA
ncbi:unnamed protein product [Alopecurus aequalis]